MSFEQKYLKYKKKYIMLKNSIRGGGKDIIDCLVTNNESYFFTKRYKCNNLQQCKYTNNQCTIKGREDIIGELQDYEEIFKNETKFKTHYKEMMQKFKDIFKYDPEKSRLTAQRAEKINSKREELQKQGWFLGSPDQ